MKTACLTVGQGKICNEGGKYGKYRTSDRMPQMILFQDVERGSLDRKLQNLAVCHSVLLYNR